jgi:hypothetical protein
MLAIAGFVIMIVMTVQTYKTARDNGRNAVLWSLLTLGVGLAFQFVIPLLIGVVLGIVWVMQGTTDPADLQAKIYGPGIIIGIVCLVLSLVGMWLVFKQASKVPDVPYPSTPPPPPANFG